VPVRLKRLSGESIPRRFTNIAHCNCPLKRSENFRSLHGCETRKRRSTPRLRTLLARTKIFCPKLPRRTVRLR
jgi:hypothetical protein